VQVKNQRAHRAKFWVGHESFILVCLRTVSPLPSRFLMHHENCIKESLLSFIGIPLTSRKLEGFSLGTKHNRRPTSTWPRFIPSRRFAITHSVSRLNASSRNPTTRFPRRCKRATTPPM